MNSALIETSKEPSATPLEPGLSGEWVEVSVPVPLRRTFTYRVPDALRSEVEMGSRVAVPFSRRKLSGFVVGFPQEPPLAADKVKAVAGLLEANVVFPEELLSFLVSAARYYMHPIGDVLNSAAPALPAGAIKHMRAEGFLESGESIPGRRAPSRSTWRLKSLVSDLAALPRLGTRQQKVIELLHEHSPIHLEALRSKVEVTRSVLRSLADKGLLSIEEVELDADPFFSDEVERDTPPTPNEEQQEAIAALGRAVETRQAQSFLLHGVTGSGKTEVYLRVIEQVRKHGRGALVLVPEIALTPQLVHRFRARFGDDIAVLHSGLKESQRRQAWNDLRSGKKNIAIGARSALFAPLKDLGVIIVDEEHDPSFKQEEGFRYHARDMALLRAHRAHALCILGSATPSLESFHRAQTGHHTLLALPERATGQIMPEVERVDMRQHIRSDDPATWLSKPLKEAIQKALAAKQQAILFLNRRGFAPTLRCLACGAAAQCPACSVTLTEHRGQKRLRCHYCDFQKEITEQCQACEADAIARVGIGTEQIEEVVRESFSEVRVARLDRDSANEKGSEAVLGQLRRGEIDVLVGTQMVTKGHDIPSVTVVGVISADQGLMFPDFRASERTFQLLAQVAGRSGRGEHPGEVIFQGFLPDHFAIQHAASHDYHAFAEEELALRRELEYPPFGRLIALRIDAGSNAQALETASMLAKVARGHAGVRQGLVSVLGPAPAPIHRLRGRFRYRVLLRSSDRAALRRVATALVMRIDKGVAPARVAVDVDPVSML